MGRQTMADVEEAYKYFDAAGSDSMDLATFSKMARSLGQTPSHELMKTITAGAETISLEQAKDFVEKMKPMTNDMTAEKMGNAFKAFDPDPSKGTGYMLYGDFKTKILEDGAKGEDPSVDGSEIVNILKNLEASGAHEPNSEHGDAINCEVYVQHVCKQLRK